MSGNLCRCGAYVGIVAAIEDAAAEDAEGLSHAALHLHASHAPPPMPSRAIAAGGAGTRFLAGGTTLYDLMKLNVETPASVVDITGARRAERASIPSGSASWSSARSRG